MIAGRTAIYARVSSEAQARENTIASQLASLRERVAADGLWLEPADCFVDEGYSGAILVRPALEQLRDAAASGRIERLYVHAPDRLARRYAHQALLIDELRRAGVEIVFLNRPIGDTPEDDLLLQVQGVIAEYERAKILERGRRGRRHAARSGSVCALTGAPFGYRYVSRSEGGGVARFDVVEEEARIVRLIFAWVGRERLSLREACRRLQEMNCRTRRLAAMARLDIARHVDQSGLYGSCGVRSVPLSAAAAQVTGAEGSLQAFLPPGLSGSRVPRRMDRHSSGSHCR